MEFESAKHCYFIGSGRTKRFEIWWADRSEDELHTLINLSLVAVWSDSFQIIWKRMKDMITILFSNLLLNMSTLSVPTQNINSPNWLPYISFYVVPENVVQ